MTTTTAQASARTTPTTPPSPSPSPSPDRFLRTILRVDAASTGAMALILFAACVPLSEWTGMHIGLTVGFGLFQLGGAAALALIAGYPVIPHALARTAVTVNAASAVGCAALALSLELTVLGRVFLLIGAVIVAVYADLEYLGLRRVRRAQAS